MAQTDGFSQALRSFLMECFQKNPNLRISARKLLKVPWISSAKRANSSAPSKPTEYNQAVRSVQEWNERLKSAPNDDQQRRRPRSLSSSLGSSKNGERFLSSDSHGKNSASQSTKLELAVNKSRPNPDAFRSPEVEKNDNWDDDFVSSINPMAFQLPQLRPHDNFAGLLSNEKLKAYATFEPVAEETSADDDWGDGDLTLRSPVKPIGVDMQDHEAWQQPSSKVKTAPHPVKQTRRKSSLSRPNEPKTAILRSIPVAQGRRLSGSRPSNVFRENSVEDYSDLIAADDAAFQRKLLAMQASCLLQYCIVLLTHSCRLGQRIHSHQSFSIRQT
jgi:serine/threonine protein kinase